MSELFSVPFISKNGIHGKVITASRLLDDAPQKSVIFETGRKAVVGSEHLHLRGDGSYYLDLSVDPRPPDTDQQSEALQPTETVIPRIEEQLVVSKRLTESGRIRVSKTVVEHPQEIDESIIHEEYTVERVPIGREVSETTPTRVEGDITIVPVYEEEVVITKRLILREEIHLIRKRREEHHPRAIALRKEHVTVRRLDPDGRESPLDK